MKYFAATAALVSVVPSFMALTINTPTGVVQCQPQMLTWSDGVPPYYLSIIPGGQPSAMPLRTFDTQSGSSQTWICDIAGGTKVTFALKDSTGTTAYTDTVTIQTSGDSSCMGGGSSNTNAAPAVDTSNTGSSSDSSGGNAGSGNLATPQAADASSSSSTAASGSSSAIIRTSVGVAAPGTTARASVSSAATNLATQSRAVATTASAATASASRAATTGTSGATTRFTGTGFGLAGFIALVGAMFL